MVDPGGAPTPRDDAHDAPDAPDAPGGADVGARDGDTSGGSSRNGGEGGGAGRTPSDAPDETTWTDAWAEERWQELLGELESGTRPHPGAKGTGGVGDPAAVPPLPADDGPRPAGRTDGATDGATDGPGTSAAGDATGWARFDAAPWVRRPGPRDWPADDAVEALEDEESHFVPPEPPPLLGHDPLKNLAWATVALVPVVLLVVLLVVRPFPPLVGEVGGAVFLAAVAVLVWRMPREREDDDDPGAVV